MEVQLLYSEETLELVLDRQGQSSKCKKLDGGYEITRDDVTVRIMPREDDPEYLKYAFAGVTFVDGQQLFDFCGF